jgi:gliding motility-associated-like protein
VAHDFGTSEYVSSIAPDPNGLHHYIAGSYDHWNLLGSTGPFGLPSTFGIAGSNDAFLVKLDRDGNVVWRNRIGGAGTDLAASVAVGPNGNIYVTGAFSGSVSLLSILTNTLTLNSSGGRDMFLACFDPAGGLLWMTRGGGTQNDEGYSVTADSTGVYVHGSFRNSATFGSTTINSPTMANSSFLVKYPLNGGEPLWVVRGEASGSAESDPGGIIASEGRVHVVGNFNSSQFMWRSATNTPLGTVNTSGSVGHVYISAFDPNGALLWLRAIDDPGDDNRSTAIAASCGQVWIGGRCHQNAVFPGLGAVQHPGAHDFMYVATLNATTGNTIRVWTARGNMHHQAEVRALHLAERGHVHFTAWFSGTLQTMQGQSFTATSGSDMLVGRLDREAQLHWARHDGALGDELPYAMTVAPDGRVFVAGAFTQRLEQPPHSHAASNNFNIFHSALDDTAPGADPARWKVLPSVCANAPPMDLNSRIPGHGDGFRATSGIIGAVNAVGPPDNVGALFSTSTATMILDLGDTIPAGHPLRITWAATTAATANLRVELSLDVSTWTSIPGTISRSSLTFGNNALTLPTATRFVRFTRSTTPASGPFQIDAVSFYTGTIAGGTWSGPNVEAAGQFNPNGLVGPVNVTYTVTSGSCIFSSTRTFIVTPPASAVITGTGEVCYSTTPVSATLQNLSPYTAIQDWEISTNGDDWTSLGIDDPWIDLPNGLPESTWFRASLRSSGCGDALTAPFYVQVGDLVPPVILNCPGDTVLHLAADSCTRTFQWPTVASTDNCGASTFSMGLLELHYTDPLAFQSIDVTNVPVFAMPAGVHRLTEVFSDVSGNTSSCTYGITVLDTIPPTISCPRDLMIEADASACGAVVNYDAPIVSDNCPGTVLTLLQGAPSGSFFPLGSTRVRFRATDAAGRTTTCSFWVTVVDRAPPTLGTCADINTSIDPGVCGAVVNITPPLATDNCGGCSGTLPTAAVPLGSYQGRSYFLVNNTVTWAAAHNAAVAAGGHLAVVQDAAHNTWLRNAVDAALPVDATGDGRFFWIGLSDAAVEGTFRWINANPTAYLNWGINEPNNIAGIEHYVEMRAAGDWNDERITSQRRYVIEIENPCLQVEQIDGPASGSVFPVGTTNMAYRVRDAAGNATTCSFTVTVADNSACGCANLQPGSACDDGDSNTVNDTIQPDCSCAGEPLDCAGVPNGTAAIDNCGVCAGGTTGIVPDATCADCAGVPNGTAAIDNCGTCVGGSTGLSPCAQDCAGVWGGTAFTDNCGTCVGGNTGLSPCVADCNGVFGGTAFIDNCNTCVGGNTGLSACTQDCAGVWGGTAFTDNCGTCVGGNTGLSPCVADCNGDFGGSAFLDNCGTCVGGNTGLSPCVADCDGDFGGTAFLDNCNTCVGGNTGLSACTQDCAGVWGGNAFLDNCNTCVGGSTGLSPCIQDCAGVWGGTAFLDNCGICVGGNTGLSPCVADCNGDFGGSAFLDNCGTCVGGNTGLSPCVADCDGDFGGTAFLDNCNTCVGGNTGLSACTQDCAGVWGGNAFLDNCNTCVGGSTGLSPCIQDCAGVWGGTAFTDNCNTCVGGNTGLSACTQDCAGVWGGTAFLDNCGTCVGGNTGLSPCVADCNGDFGGTAFLDNCNTCVGGSTGLSPCAQDCAGVWGGTAFTDNCGTCVGGNTGNMPCVADCNGVFGGSAFLDNCNTCVGGNTGLSACTQDCAGVWGGTAFLDNCGTCVGGNTGLSPCVADCNGDFGGTAFLDNCNTCVGGSTGLSPCAQDCAGVWGGTAFTDNCGTCVGGNTGLSPCVADCNGDFGGSAFLDNCNTCVGGNTGLSPCVQDCAGVWGGTAFIDDCGVCSAGTTGVTPNSTCADCTGVPNGSALPGTPCDDGNPATFDDTWDSNCSCTGTLVTCTSNAGPDQVVCGNTATMQATGTGYWYYPADLQTTSPSSPTAVFTAATAGVFQLFWIVELVDCMAIDTVEVTFLAQPDPAFAYAASNYCTNSPPPTPWVAEIGGLFSSEPTGLEIASFDGTITPQASQPGTYTITYTIAGSCPAAMTTTLSIDGMPSAAWTPLDDLCTGQPAVALEGQVLGTPGGIWSGPYVTGDTFEAVESGSFPITYTVSSGSCTASETHSVAVSPSPTAYAGEDITVCSNHAVLAANGNDASGSWTLPTGVSTVDANLHNAIVLLAEPGTYTLTWTVMNGACSASDTMVLTFLQASHVEADAGPDQYLDMAHSTQLMGLSSPGAETTWRLLYGSGTIADPTANQTEVYNLAPGANAFLFTAMLDVCSSATDTVIVHIAGLFIPEGFSPNGDGVNDRFEITGIAAYPGNTFQVFNRWGQEVYAARDYDNSWDGRSHNGGELPSSTYFYVLNLPGLGAFNGPITLKR